MIPLVAFQSTRPAWGATRGCGQVIVGAIVSIHAPRVGRDASNTTIFRYTIGFNPRAPRGARRDLMFILSIHLWRFNPRAPRGARLNMRQEMLTQAAFQSTRPAWGATRVVAYVPLPPEVSIHAPRVGRDPAKSSPSTFTVVSIHAPRVGRDNNGVYEHLGADGFNPRAPRGARLVVDQTLFKLQKFQSTRPAWGATKAFYLRQQSERVSIHAPRVGRDAASGAYCGIRIVSIHAPRVGRDATCPAVVICNCCFNPRAPRGARRKAVRSER